MSKLTADLIEFLQHQQPKTEEEIVVEIKEFVENEEFTLKELKKKISELSKPYDYSNLCEEILKKFGVVYKVPDIKKLLSIVELIPK